MGKKVKIGIIGCGGIANGKHMPSLAKLDNAEMVAFCDIIEERAKEAAEKYGVEGAKVYVDYNEMLKNEDSRGVKAYLWNRTQKFIIITFALAVFFAVMAESVIYILIGEVMPQYVVHMQILSVAFAFVPLYSLYSMFLTNIGKSKAVLIINYIALAASIGITF